MKQHATADPAKPDTGTVVSCTKKPRLTRPQELMLLELDEPFREGGDAWYFPRKDLRTLRVLERHGLAKYIDGSAWRLGYALTPAGKDYVRAMTETAAQP